MNVVLRGRSFIRLPISTACLALASCVAAGPAGPSRAEVAAMINNELETGANTDAIRAFFDRHAFPYKYDMAHRFFAATVSRGHMPPLSIYIYTDMQQRLTVAQVEEPPVQQR